MKVQKLVIGKPIDTGAIQNEGAFESVKRFSSTLQGDATNVLRFKLDPEDVVYGLGQNMRGMNKRGFVYESFCNDDPSHTPDKASLYGAHNFFIVQGEVTWGLYIDFGGRVKFDVGFLKSDVLTIEMEGDSFAAYHFEGRFETVVTRFREMIGMSYVPPKWGMGYQQSRWSYENHTVVDGILDKMDALDIPLDAIYLDIDYMERFKDFTVSNENFPDFQPFVQRLKARGVKLVPIIDAGVKIEPGYDVYEEGVAKGYFVEDSEGKPFVAAVWPGLVHFPDALNSEARKWFGDKYHALIEMGIDGFWNDMNEPAIFYSEQGLKEAIAFVKSKEDENLDIYSFFELKDRMLGISNATSDYKAMYHNLDGIRVNHYDTHNLYGYNITRSAAEGFERYQQDKRFLLITRASHVGMAKFSGIWTGDNASWWEHLLLNVQMMPALNMVGFIYSGADTGGFGSHCSGELLTRWMQFSLFTPLLRNHSAMGTRRQEPWAFDALTLARVRNTIRMRYALIPYLYSEMMTAILESKLLFAPLALAYDGRRVKGVEDQLLFGSHMMLAPVVVQNAKGRMVHVPETMMYWKITTFEQLSSTDFKILSKGDVYLEVNLDEIPVFIRPGGLVPLVKPQNRVNKLNYDTLTVVGFVPDQATYTLWDDDGESKSYREKYIKMSTKKSHDGYEVKVDTNVLSLKQIEFYLMASDGTVTYVKQALINETAVQFI